jgi:RNA polymerase sigma-70 factor (ECF subfamily)
VADRRSDEQLVAATLAGNREAFGELVARHRDSVFSLANGRLRDFEAAGDATQEAFLKAYLDLADLRDPAKFRAWVQRIAERIVITVARRPRREIPTAGLKIQDERWSELKLAERADLARRVRDDLSVLSEPTRTALILHHVNGYSQDEVAERLGLTRAAVKTRLSRARAQLRRGGTRKGARRGRIGRIRGR